VKLLGLPACSIYTTNTFKMSLTRAPDFSIFAFKLYDMGQSRYVCIVDAIIDMQERGFDLDFKPDR